MKLLLLHSFSVRQRGIRVVFELRRFYKKYRFLSDGPAFHRWAIGVSVRGRGRPSPTLQQRSLIAAQFTLPAPRFPFL